MVGYSTMKEAMLWVQTTGEARVHCEYYETGQTRRFRTQPVETHKQTAFVAKLIADSLAPGKQYTYELFINGQAVPRDYPLQFQSQHLWQWRTDPPAFTFATGSCSYFNETELDRPGKPYGGDYGIFTSIHRDRPDFMLWLGDNVYLREADWNSQTGIWHRYTHDRATTELQPLLGSTHHYAIWDDHDFGPNDSDRSFWNKHLTEEAFNLFWANPNTNQTGQGGITGTFQWADVQFFMLDDRYFRTPNERHTGERHILGEAQMQWLADALTFSRATFKIIAIGGQVLNPVARYENYATYPQERERLLRLISENNVEGVLFLTGDRHHTVLSRLDRADNYPLYDLTCSPLTSGAGLPKNEGNFLKVDDTMYGEQNYALLTVSGPLRDRKLTMDIRDKRGKTVWKREIAAQDLRKPSSAP